MVKWPVLFKAESPASLAIKMQNVRPVNVGKKKVPDWILLPSI